jgi:hypothetical protein
MGDTTIVERGGAGLSPGLSIWVVPNGMPARPVVMVDRGGIDEPRVAALPVSALPVPEQALDAAPVMPPPSKRGVAVCDIGLAAPEQPMEGSAGLVPGAVISVAPSGMPVGATGEPDSMARGEVALSAEMPISSTCARTELPPARKVATVAIAKRIFMGSSFM